MNYGDVATLQYANFSHTASLMHPVLNGMGVCCAIVGELQTSCSCSLTIVVWLLQYQAAHQTLPLSLRQFHGNVWIQPSTALYGTGSRSLHFAKVNELVHVPKGHRPGFPLFIMPMHRWQCRPLSSPRLRRTLLAELNGESSTSTS